MEGDQHLCRRLKDHLQEERDDDWDENFAGDVQRVQ